MTEKQVERLPALAEEIVRHARWLAAMRRNQVVPLGRYRQASAELRDMSREAAKVWGNSANKRGGDDGQ